MALIVAGSLALAAGVAEGLVALPFASDSTSVGGDSVALILLGLVLFFAAPFVVARVSGAPTLRFGFAAVAVGPAGFWLVRGVTALLGDPVWDDAVALAAGFGAMGATALRTVPGESTAATYRRRALAVGAVAALGAIAFARHPEFAMLSALPAVALADEMGARTGAGRTARPAS